MKILSEPRMSFKVPKLFLFFFLITNILTLCLCGQKVDKGTQLINVLKAKDCFTSMNLAKSFKEKNYTDSNGRSLFLWSVASGCTDVVKLLYKKDQRIDLQDKTGLSPLFVASDFGYSDIVKFLLENGANVEQRSNGSTPLLISIQKGHVGIARLLLEHGAQVDISDPKGITPLMLAAQNGLVEIVTLLVEKKSNVNLLTADKTTALFVAAQNGYSEVLKILLESGANPNLPRNDGATALMISAQKGYLDIVKLLISYKSDPLFKTKTGKTATDLATDESIKFLLSTIGKSEFDKFCAALKFEQQEDAIKIAKTIEPIDSADTLNISALMYASSYGDLEICKILIDRGANINNLSNDGNTALLYASKNGNPDIVKLLLNQGININIQNKYGISSLMRAVNYGNTEVVKLLLESGANLDLKDNNGNSVFAYKTNGQIENMLYEKEAKDTPIGNQFTGVMFIEINMKSGSDKLSDTSFDLIFQDVSNCKKYKLDSPFGLDMSTQPRPCRIIGKRKESTLFIEVINTGLPEEDLMSILAKFKSNCEK